MVTIGMNYAVLPGKEATFEKAFQSVLDAMDSASGHVRSQLFQEVKTPGRYLILSEWSNQEGFTTFVRSEAFAKVTNWGKEHILAERPRHTTYTES